MINPSSKISLKLSCLMACDRDIEKAERLYKFLADGVETMPDFDIPNPSVYEQIKQGAGQFFGWIKENKGDIIDAYSFIQQIRGGAGVSAAETAGEVAAGASEVASETASAASAANGAANGLAAEIPPLIK